MKKFLIAIVLVFVTSFVAQAQNYTYVFVKTYVHTTVKTVYFDEYLDGVRTGNSVGVMADFIRAESLKKVDDNYYNNNKFSNIIDTPIVLTYTFRYKDGSTKALSELPKYVVKKVFNEIFIYSSRYD